jgi:cysteine sulfinate desulfinase/cysteine desulfurase-like protein
MTLHLLRYILDRWHLIDIEPCCNVLMQPISEISAAIKSMSGGQEGSQRIRVHTDAAQSVGKVPVDVQALGVDMATIVGHKVGGCNQVGCACQSAGFLSAVIIL